ncbi:uncharacterized protein sosie [Venturia canescens]|uniref:uncharacterized protein sosie n=1 Tax=Venturia canescens TaxID=32260 RepID=UPI001C9C5C6A|nr:uncharacterized protein LOC122407105 [Venturia canescens]
MKNATMIHALAPVLLILLSCTSFSISALTTFGKTNPQTQNQPPPPPTPVGNARECKVESDCITIQNTTCLQDRPRDSKTRCLCGDYTAPVNGRCNNKGKAAHVPCSDDAECHDGAECVNKNSGSSGKECICKDGFWEENWKCNNAETIFRSSTIAIVAAALLFVKVTGYST